MAGVVPALPSSVFVVVENPGSLLILPTMPRRPHPNLLAALDRLAGAEAALAGTEFLAPVLRGHGVAVRVAGVRCVLALDPPDFEGWGVFRALSPTRAQLVGRAGMARRRQYLALFPAVRLILCRQEGGQWLAVPANRSDARFDIEGLIPLRLAGDAELDLFETAVARFDGGRFWFDEPDPRADPGAAAYLRETFHAGAAVGPEALSRPGLTADQRRAYAIARAEKVAAQRAERGAREREARAAADAAAARERATAEGRVRRALLHAGARLRDFRARDDHLRVSYEVDGRRFTSVVRPNDLSVMTAGVCLSGHDRQFDLASLVGVLREGGEAGRLVVTA